MLIENFRMALDSIFANKMRSFLTMLGIVIGISAVITILSVGSGATNEITKTFSDIGSTTISITANDPDANDDLITDEDIDTLRESIDNLRYISPEGQLTGQVTAAGSDSRLAALTFGTPDLRYISTQMSDELLYGRYFDQNDYQQASDVVVIDSDTAKSLFGRVDAVGEDIRMSVRNTTINLTVIGVTEGMFSDMQGSFAEDGMPVFLSAPNSTIDRYFPGEEAITQLMARVESTDDIDSVSNQIVRLLELRHNRVGDDIYNATNFLNALDQINNVLSLFINFIAAVAGIALVVGGIGVMNIMLVSVTERTKEIGTRKALGATTRHILVQFLMESVILSVLGGLIGLIIGTLAALGIASALGIQAQFTLSSILLVIGFSSAIGIFFGIYPARKAAELNPIDALRHE